MSVNESLAVVAESVFAECMEKNNDIEVICLATTDGFPVYAKTNLMLNFDIDKMAAASSTLYSVGNAVSKQILSKSFKITYIEAEQGNIGFISLSVNDRDFVLSMSANESMNVGQLRVYINRIAKDLISRN